ncbi:MAG: 4-oxalomesaconate hydratase [Hyphomicrobiales bacterium]|jgi:aminocarboxymuconate-semialdehyde decarboxylase|nr:4-oxalomesaconate hydratase [Hyphomicrobiales bacterium]
MIDIYTHIFPDRFYEELTKSSPKLGNIGARLRGIKPLFDLDVRFRMMDDVAPGYQQAISLPNPPLEDIATPEVARHLARVGNDSMAELCRKHPDRFPAFAAAVSLLDVDSALLEIDRAVNELGAKGIQIFTNIAGKPLDLPEFEPVFAAMSRHDLPIWMHPARTSDMTDYASEKKSRFEMWWCFGWPYETSVAMARIVFAGLYDRYPNLNIITHHCGGMIPTYDGRLGPGLDVLGSRTLDEDYSNVLSSLKRPHLEYFHNFYGDTAMFGGTTGLHSGLAFFGADHIVFSTDSPLGPIKETIAALDRLDLSAADREKIMGGNARRLLKL